MIEVTRWKRRDGEGGIVEAIQWTGEFADIPRLQPFGCTSVGYVISPEDMWDGRVRIDDMYWLWPGEWLVRTEGYVDQYTADDFRQLFEPAELPA